MEIQARQEGQTVRVEVQLMLPTIPSGLTNNECPECPSREPNQYDYSEQRPLKSEQAKLVLWALRSNSHGLTTAELQREPYNVCHPPARILDLKSAGYRVEKYPQRDLNGMALWVYFPREGGADGDI